MTQPPPPPTLQTAPLEVVEHCDNYWLKVGPRAVTVVQHPGEERRSVTPLGTYNFPTSASRSITDTWNRIATTNEHPASHATSIEPVGPIGGLGGSLLTTRPDRGRRGCALKRPGGWVRRFGSSALRQTRRRVVFGRSVRPADGVLTAVELIAGASSDAHARLPVQPDAAWVTPEKG